MISWCYSENVPTNAVGTIITLRDTIPHATNLLPILRDMEAAFGNGMRSVVMTIKPAEAESRKVVVELATSSGNFSQKQTSSVLDT